MGQVLKTLVGGVGVDGRHHPPLDPEAVVEHLCQGHEAVRGAASVRDHRVGPGVVPLVVDTHHHRVVLVGGRGRDDDLPGAPLVDVHPRLLGVGEEAGGLDHDVDPQLTPGQVAWVPLGEEADGAPVDPDLFAVRADGRAEGAERGVVLEEVGEGRGVADVVDGDHLDLRVEPVRGPEDVPPDPPEPVDADLD